LPLAASTAACFVFRGKAEFRRFYGCVGATWIAGGVGETNMIPGHDWPGQGD